MLINKQKPILKSFLSETIQVWRTLMFVYWFLTALLFLLLELGHPGLLFFVSFAFGAFAAGAVSFVAEEFVFQVGVFLGATIVALAVLKYWVVRYAAHTPKHGHSNIYALEGKQGLVVKEISPNQPGQVNLNGEIWLARTPHDVAVPAGTEVVVLHVKGSHLVVDVKTD
jgi:membrane protein implicated in regulation of membrane protease activity